MSSAAAAAKQQPRVGAGREGFVIKWADGAFQLKLRGYENFLAVRVQRAF